MCSNQSYIYPHNLFSVALCGPAGPAGPGPPTHRAWRLHEGYFSQSVLQLEVLLFLFVVLNVLSGVNHALKVPTNLAFGTRRHEAEEMSRDLKVRSSNGWYDILHKNRYSTQHLIPYCETLFFLLPREKSCMYINPSGCSTTTRSSLSCSQPLAAVTCAFERIYAACCVFCRLAACSGLTSKRVHEPNRSSASERTSPGCFTAQGPEVSHLLCRLSSDRNDAPAAGGGGGV